MLSVALCLLAWMDASFPFILVDDGLMWAKLLVVGSPKSETNRSTKGRLSKRQNEGRIKQADKLTVGMDICYGISPPHLASEEAIRPDNKYYVKDYCLSANCSRPEELTS